MKVRYKGYTWAKIVKCTGHRTINSNGCGAELLVEKSDLFLHYSNIAFECCECKLINYIDGYKDNPGKLPKWKGKELKRYHVCYIYTDESIEEVEASSEKEAIAKICDEEDLVWVREIE